MASIIALAIPFCRNLLAFRWHIRVKVKPAATFKVAAIALGVISEFNGSALTAIKPKGEAFVIKFK